MKMKLGIIGFGGMANWHFEHAPEAGVRVLSAYDIDPAKLDDARKLGLKAYNSLQDFLADDEINFVLVATPNQVHKELAIAALRAGMHVMVEKPATLSVKDWDDMVAVSESTGKILTVHQNRRWDKDYRSMRAVVESGGLGQVAVIESRVFGTGGALFGWRGFRQFGGGMLYDWGVHLVDQLLDMYPDRKVKSVFASLMSLQKEEVDDYDKLLIEMESGPLLHIEICTFAFRDMPRWYVVGGGGTLVIEDFACSQGGYTKPRLTDTPIAPVVVMTAAGPTRMMAPRPPETKEDFPLPQVSPEWTDLYKNLVDVMNSRAELIVKPAQVRRVLQVLEALFRSAEAGKSIEVNL
jgi:predicted dehydrogenase